MSAVTPEQQLQGLIEYIAGELVDSPDDFEVISERRGGSVHVTLKVKEEAMGRVIGRQGRIAKAMRTLVMITGSRNNVRASLDIEG
ncbi:MAG: KH domain-containing protein [Thermomicrobiales bacterium]